MSYRNYSTANSHIVDPSGNGDFTTIAAALTAAVIGQTIFIRPGTYTENLTLKAGVNLVAFNGDQTTPNVIINGKCTYSDSGKVSISNIKLQTNSDFSIVVSGSSASVLELNNCFINCLNNTGISFTNSNAASNINAYDCFADTGTTGIALYSSSSVGTLTFKRFQYTNTGSSITANTNSAGTVNLQFAACIGIFTTSSTGTLSVSYCALGNGNNTVITTAGTGTGQIEHSELDSGSASAISVGAGTTVTLINSRITSSNTNTITGSGTLNYGAVTFAGSSSGINTSTLVPLTTLPSAGGGNSATAFFYYLATSETNIIGGGTSGFILGSHNALTKVFDTSGTAFSGGNLTIPTTGYWSFTFAVTFSSVQAGADIQIAPINTTNGQNWDNPVTGFGYANPSGYVGVNTTFIAHTSAGDVWNFAISYAGTAMQTSGILGSSTYFTYVAGHFIGT